MQQQQLQPPVGLARYGSAPGKYLAAIAESVVGEYSSPAPMLAAGSEPMMSRFYSADSSCLTAESKSTTAAASQDLQLYNGKDLAAAAAGGECCMRGEDSGIGSQQHPLLRHSSSPAGFFSHLMLDDGYNHTKGIGYRQAADSFHVTAGRTLKSQLSFSRQDSLSQISEISIPDLGDNIGNCTASDDAVIQSYMSNDFPGSWDDSNSILFPAPSNRTEANNGDIISNFSNINSQFSLPKTPHEVKTFFQMHQGAVPFKIRAKRGCATHPRSIAERERRTRISEKLRKLQELVPNMNEQTNTADMLDLAVQHIKLLQSQVLKLTEEQSNCICEARNR